MRPSSTAAALLLCAIAIGAAWSSEATGVPCPAGSSPLDYLDSHGYVLLSRYDAIDYDAFQASAYGKPLDTDGVVDILPGTSVKCATDALERCSSTPGCQAVNYADLGYGPNSFLKRGAGGKLINLLNGRGTGPASTINESQFFPNDCTGLFISVKGLDKCSLGCIRESCGSPQAIMACLKCGYAPDVASNRQECANCVTGLKPFKYKNVERCYDCRKAPLGFSKCRQCLAVLADGGRPGASKFCNTVCTDADLHCLLESKSTPTCPPPPFPHY